MVMLMPDFTDRIDCVCACMASRQSHYISTLSASVEPESNSVIVDSMTWVHRIACLSYLLLYRVMQKLHQLLHGCRPCISHPTPQQPIPAIQPIQLLYATLSPHQTLESGTTWGKTDSTSSRYFILDIFQTYPFAKPAQIFVSV